MEIVNRLQSLVAVNNNAVVPVLSGCSAGRCLSREESTALGQRVLSALEDSHFDRLTFSQSGAETRIHFAVGDEYSTLSFLTKEFK